LICPEGDELHVIEKLFIEYAWVLVFYTKSAAPRDRRRRRGGPAGARTPGGRAADSEAPSQSGPPCKLLRSVIMIL
jgi:hypothetical protein